VMLIAHIGGMPVEEFLVPFASAASAVGAGARLGDVARATPTEPPVTDRRAESA
jgi:hypothetical protein